MNELVKPTEDALTQVLDWLQDSGVEDYQLEYSPAKDWIKVTLPVHAVERLLDTEYSVYKHEDGTHLVRTPEWSLPAHLHEHIDTIQPTNSFFRATPMKSTVRPVAALGTTIDISTITPATDATDLTVGAVCNETSGVTPACLRTLYGTIDYKPQVPGVNRVGLTDYLGETNNRSDVHLFLQMFRPGAAAAAYEFTFDQIDGGSVQQTPDNATQLAAGTDLEGNLDAETILGIDYPTPLTAFTTYVDLVLIHPYPCPRIFR